MIRKQKQQRRRAIPAGLLTGLIKGLSPVWCLLLGATIGYAQSQSKLIARGAELQRLSNEYSFTEGPAVDKRGNVYFTDQPNDRILQWSAADGSLSVFMTGARRSNGLYVDHDGDLLSCADQDNQLLEISLDKQMTELVGDFKGRKLNGPNDLWVDARGGIYFTDPFYKRNYWSRTEKEIEEENVYYLAPDRVTLTVAATGFVRPNGIIGTPDGKTLYVADINDKKTYSFTINPDGTLTNRKLFTEMGSDGMTIDKKGNVYLTGQGVTVFNPAGEKIEHIPIEERWTANVCFGGKKRNMLFITAMGSVYTLKMRARGVR